MVGIRISKTSSRIKVCLTMVMKMSTSHLRTLKKTKMPILQPNQQQIHQTHIQITLLLIKPQLQTTMHQ